jgi:catechol 2,3-dioxygenase-like lactoylglutathione lyase family enzyme
MQFNSLIPELESSNFEKSRDFYLNILGFKVEYERPEKKFLFLSLQESQLMIEEQNGHWDTGPLERPYGRGVNFQINIDNIDPLLKSLSQHNYPLFKEPAEHWRRKGEVEVGAREFLVQDPDGYLLRFAQSLGERAIKA